MLTVTALRPRMGRVSAEEGWWADPQWWTAVGTVVLAVATLVLSGASIVAGVMAVKAFRKQAALVEMESRRDLEREESEKRADASRVAAWTVYTGPDDADWVAMIRNPSHLPIYDVKLAWKWGNVLVRSNFDTEQDIGLVIPRDLPQEVRIGESFAEGVDQLQKKLWNSEGGATQVPVSVRLSFRDAAGEQWVREWDGKLVHISEASDLTRMQTWSATRRRAGH